MEHHGADLNMRLELFRRTFAERARIVETPSFPPGIRVFWGPTGAEAVGTVRAGLPDADGWVLVSWDGIGTYRENPANLRPAPPAP